MVSAREVVEACAIALWHSSDDNPPPWDKGCPNVKESFRRDVIAVIRALAAQPVPLEVAHAYWQSPPTAASALNAMLTALADEYEREGGG